MSGAGLKRDLVLHVTIWPLYIISAKKQPRIRLHLSDSRQNSGRIWNYENSPTTHQDISRINLVLLVILSNILHIFEKELKKKSPVNSVEMFCCKKYQKGEFWSILAIFGVKTHPKHGPVGQYSTHF